jgi:hypothetical protein
MKDHNMNKKTLGALVLAILLGVGALELNAQQNRGMRGAPNLRQGSLRQFRGPRVFGKPSFNRAPPSGPEQIMRMRDRLQLMNKSTNLMTFEERTSSVELRQWPRWLN